MNNIIAFTTIAFPLEIWALNFFDKKFMHGNLTNLAYTVIFLCRLHREKGRMQNKFLKGQMKYLKL